MSINKITVIDFETATSAFNSACSIGITVIEDGKIIDNKHYYIQPPNNKYSSINIGVHGIKPEITANSPIFPEVWEQIKVYFDNSYIAAHNASFDLSVLKTTLSFYDIPQPHFMYFDTLHLFDEWLNYNDKRTLDALCRKFGICLDCHHSAGDDSKATAELIIYHYKECGYNDLTEYFNSLDLKNYGFISVNKKSAYISYKKHKSADEIAASTDTTFVDSQFNGKTFLFTGELSTLSREEAMQEVVKRGGLIRDGISKSVDILVNANKDGVITSKVNKALELQNKGCAIQIINESEFLRMLNL
ncbi:MAG: exonuclease domain-containing protein [Candidatus Coproplasma sp.]